MTKIKQKNYWLAFPISPNWHRVKAPTLKTAKQEFTKGTSWKTSQVRCRKTSPPKSKGKSVVKRLVKDSEYARYGYHYRGRKKRGTK